MPSFNPGYKSSFLNESPKSTVKQPELDYITCTKRNMSSPKFQEKHPNLVNAENSVIESCYKKKEHKKANTVYNRLLAAFGKLPKAPRHTKPKPY